MFFTEDQREHLRKAYTQDPYPNQSRIEQLAMELSVSTKTIINWFHNHRMRSKPRNSSPSGTTPSQGGDTNLSATATSNAVKPEPQDELSNQSTATSSDPGQPQGQEVKVKESDSRSEGSQPGMSQWMFPQFEPVPLKRPASENSMLTDRNSEDGEKDGPKEAKSKLEMEDPEAKPTVEEPAGKCETQPKEKTSSGNRRKSACPQWAYEGVHLDRSLQADCAVESPLASSSPSTEGQQSAAPTPRSADAAESSEPIRQEVQGEKVEPSSDQESKRKDKIEKLQQAVISADLDWEEVDRQENIEKLQKNLSQDSEESWAF